MADNTNQTRRIEIEFDGGRFDAIFGLPLDALPELVDFQKLVNLIAARVRAGKKGDQQARTTRRLEKDFSLTLIDPVKGSYKGVLDPIRNSQLDIDDEFDEIIAELEHDFQQIEDHQLQDIRPEELAVLKRLGTRLPAGEDFRVRLQGNRTWTFNKSTARLIKSFDASYPNSVSGVLIGKVNDLRTAGVGIEFGDGSGRHKVEVTKSQFDLIKEFFEPEKPVIVRMVAEYSTNKSRITSVDRPSVLDVIGREDMDSRLKHLAQLEHGWFDGEGEQISTKALFCANAFDRKMRAKHIDFKIYPTPEGGLQFESYPGDGYCEILIAASGEMEGVCAFRSMGDETDRVLQNVDEAVSFVHQWHESLRA